MSGLPPLEQPSGYPHRVLPDGVYACDEAAFRARFVDEFPTSTSRRDICNGFFALRGAAAAQVSAALQWVDGSFVEGEENPHDVDIVSFVDADVLNELAPAAQHIVRWLLGSGDGTKQSYLTHTFLVAAYAPNHPLHQRYERARRLWRNWWGTTRDLPNPPGPDTPGVHKGFVSMTLGDPTRVPVVSTERSAP